jgi:hypothetical protein
MKILLINNNPVVSRLTALSARKEDIEIDEVQEVTELTAYNYDIVFVDADSWNEDVKSTIFTHIETQKRVLFYAQDDNQDLELFDKGILKPFLPSEVSAVIRSVEEIETLDNISNEIEEEKRVDLTDNAKETLLDKDTVELESSEHKTDLIDELTKIDDQKNEDIVLSSTELEDELFKDASDEIKINASDFASKNIESDLFELDIKDEKISLDDDLLLTEEKVSDTKSDEALVDFDLENDNKLMLDDVDLFDDKDLNEELSDHSTEVVKEKELEIPSDEVSTEVLDEFKEEIKEESKEEIEEEIEEEKLEIETKILDPEEIEAIKGILEDDTSETMELEDLIAPSIAATGLSAVALSSKELIASDELVDDEIIEKKKKKKSKKERKMMASDTESSDTLVDTLSNLKVESLRELLAGATVSIKIEFPKA